MAQYPKLSFLWVQDAASANHTQKRTWSAMNLFYSLRFIFPSGK